MRRRDFLKAAAAGLSVLPAYGQQRPAPPGLTLRQATGDRMLIGTAIGPRTLGNPARAALLTEQFNCVTAENEMKPMSLQPAQGRFTFEQADRLVAFANDDHHMKVIGHTLCWHSQAPRFLFQNNAGEPLRRYVALENLKAHIDTVVKHFRGKVLGWDVVNEAVSDLPEDDLRSTPALSSIGDDFVLKAFEYAHEADPHAELYYNDYNIEIGEKRERALRLIRRIKQAGLRIDAVGIQGHWLLKRPSVADIEEGIRAFIDQGVNVMITEMDIDVLTRNRGAGADVTATELAGFNPYTTGLVDEVQKAQADRYGALFAMFLRYPQVKRVTLWGLSDGDSWLNNFPVAGRTNHPLLFDRQLQPKPAYRAVIKALRSA